MAVVAEIDTGHEPKLTGVARYSRSDGETTADVGLVVDAGEGVCHPRGTRCRATP